MRTQGDERPRVARLRQPTRCLLYRLPDQRANPVVVRRRRLWRWIELRVSRVQDKVGKPKDLCERRSGTPGCEVILEAAARSGPDIVRRVDQADRRANALSDAMGQKSGEIRAEQKIG